MMREKKVKITETRALSMLLLFYLLCDVLTLTSLLIWGVSPNVGDKFESQFITAVLFAPIIETLVIHLPLILLLYKLKMHPFFVILITAVLFALCHLGVGLAYPLIIFYPGLILTCTFYYFFTRFDKKTAILSTTFVHMVYNFTSLMAV